MKRILAALALALLLSTRIVSAATLTTVFTVPPDNGNDGVMFDVVADKPLTVDALAFSAFAAGGGTVEIYTKTGTFVGSEATAASWTLVASSSFTAAQAGVALAPTALSSRVSIQGGARQAFYIKLVGTDISYTNGDGVGTLEAQDSNLRIFEGSGISGSFGGTSTARIPNVTVTYSTPENTLSTAFNSNNSASGIMFDIVAKQTFSVRALQFALAATTTANVEVYTKTGTFVGSETTPAAWTSIGLASVTSPASISSPTPFFLTSPVSVAAGARQAFYIRAATSNIVYTDGTALGAVAAENALLQILEGSGITGTFTGVAGTPRIPNLTLYYAQSAAPDTAAPKITIVGSKTIRTTAKSVLIFGLATDDIGVASVRATFKGKKGTTVRQLSPGANGLFSLKLKPLPGKNRVTFVALDTAGKSSAPSKVTVTQTVAK